MKIMYIISQEHVKFGKIFCLILQTETVLFCALEGPIKLQNFALFLWFWVLMVDV